MSATALRKQVKSEQKREVAWVHPSVRALITEANQEPIAAITQKARRTVFSAMQRGWNGPPYDPFTLAEHLGISLEPSQEVADARTTATSNGKFLIEFNPNRSRARTNFSVAHEIAHTLFSDCAKEIRHRYTHTETGSTEWQLEALCNIAAAEILMPTGSFDEFTDWSPSIDTALSLREKFLVSTESVLLRYMKLTSWQCCMFAAHRDESRTTQAYLIDYMVPSRTWPIRPQTGLLLPQHTQLTQCTAIGYTSKFEETWLPSEGTWSIEAIGVGPYPDSIYPRVVGIVRPVESNQPSTLRIKYLRGDASSPHRTNVDIIAQVTNDKAITWGRGFALYIRKKWPQAQREYSNWVMSNKANFRRGNLHTTYLDKNLLLASLIAEEGYGPSLFPRLDYAALEESLSKLGELARGLKATVHVPRIGAGEARGDWRVISEVIDEILCCQGTPVIVYDLPAGNNPKTMS